MFTRMSRVLLWIIAAGGVLLTIFFALIVVIIGEMSNTDYLTTIGIAFSIAVEGVIVTFIIVSFFGVFVEAANNILDIRNHLVKGNKTSNVQSVSNTQTEQKKTPPTPPTGNVSNSKFDLSKLVEETEKETQADK